MRRSLKPRLVIHRYAECFTDRLRNLMLVIGETETFHTIGELASIAGISKREIRERIQTLDSDRHYLRLESRQRGHLREYRLVRQ